MAYILEWLLSRLATYGNYIYLVILTWSVGIMINSMKIWPLHLITYSPHGNLVILHTHTRALIVDADWVPTMQVTEYLGLYRWSMTIPTLDAIAGFIWHQCRWKTPMVHWTFIWGALYVLFKFVKSLITHLEVGVGSLSKVVAFFNHVGRSYLWSPPGMSEYSHFLPLSPNWARGVLSSPAGRAGVTSYRYRSPERSSFWIAVKLGGDESWGRISGEFVHGRRGSLMKRLTS